MYVDKMRAKPLDLNTSRAYVVLHHAESKRATFGDKHIVVQLKCAYVSNMIARYNYRRFADSHEVLSTSVVGRLGRSQPISSASERKRSLGSPVHPAFYRSGWRCRRAISRVSLATALLQPAVTGPDLWYSYRNSESHIIPNSYIVVLHKDTHAAVHDQHIREIEILHEASTRLRRFGDAIHHAVADLTGLTHRYSIGSMKAYAGKFSEDVLEHIRSRPEVAYVERDSVVWATETERSAPWVSSSSVSLRCADVSAGPCTYLASQRPFLRNIQPVRLRVLGRRGRYCLYHRYVSIITACRIPLLTRITAVSTSNTSNSKVGQR